MVTIRRQFVVPTILFALLTPSVSFSQSATIGVYKTDGTPACPLPPGQFIPLEVKLNATVAPISTARFKLVPSCPGATIFGPVDYNLSFSPCAQSGRVLAQVVVITPASCSSSWGFYFDVVPYTGDANMKLTDCNGFPMTGADAIQVIDYSPCDANSGWVAPYRPTPANGASNVSVNTTLSYVGPANTIQLATDPNDLYDHVICAASGNWYGAPLCAYPVNPGPLAPNTTYYWRALNIAYYYNGPYAESDLFSFTTGDAPLPTEPATWGRVKAMYRD